MHRYLLFVIQSDIIFIRDISDSVAFLNQQKPGSKANALDINALDDFARQAAFREAHTERLNLIDGTYKVIRLSSIGLVDITYATSVNLTEEENSTKTLTLEIHPRGE